MKKILSVIFSLTFIGFVGTASALTIKGGATDVGGLDQLIISDFLGNSGDQTEVDWVNTVLGTSFNKTDMTKYDSLINNWLEVDFSGGDQWALDLQTDGGYFFIKTGNFVLDGLKGKGPDDLPDSFLYKNLPSNKWGVVSLSIITDELNTFLAGSSYSEVTIKSFDVTKFSHIGELGDQSEVPEPATMLLFGSGLAALAGVRRRMMK